MMSNIHCLIIEDEPLAAEVIENYLARLENVSWQKIENPVQAVQLISEHRYDLIFLDIEMPFLSGLDFLRSMKQLPPVIITTAYSDYAVESYEFEVVDYLVKPVSFPRFMKAYERATKLITATKPKETAHQPGSVDYLFLKVGRRYIKVQITDILFVESLKDYVKVVTVSGSYISYSSLTSITESLPSEYFVRVHRSFTVAIDKIDTIDGNCLLIGKKVVPVSRDRKSEVMNRILKKQ